MMENPASPASRFEELKLSVFAFAMTDKALAMYASALEGPGELARMTVAAALNAFAELSGAERRRLVLQAFIIANEEVRTLTEETGMATDPAAAEKYQAVLKRLRMLYDELESAPGADGAG